MSAAQPMNNKMTFTFNSIVSFDDTTIVTVSAPLDDWKASLAIVRAFVDRAGEHLNSYAPVSEISAVQLIDVLETSQAHNLTDIDMPKFMFLDMCALIENFQSHGYGVLQHGDAPPIPEEAYDRLQAECTQAAELLARL